MTTTLTDDEIREMAKARVGFRAHAAVYVLANAAFWAVWWLGGPARGDGDYPWPMWATLGWGIGLAFHAWGAYGGGRDAVAREEEKLRARLGRR